MSFKISILGSPDNRFVQYDVDRQIKVEGAEGGWNAHFYTDCLDVALVVPHDDDGIVDVPNTLLMRTCPITVAIYRQDVPGGEGRTVYMQSFRIQPRVMPEDYRYESNVGYIDWIAKAAEVEAYIESLRALKESGAFNGVGIESARIDGGGHLILIRTDGVEIDAGKLPGGGGGGADPEEIKRIVDAALAEAKASGEFDGPKGDPGERGEKGEKGDPGERGATGATGATGEQGVGVDRMYISGNALHVVLTDGRDLDLGEFPPVKGAEMVANKSQIITDSDTLYPSNKAVRDYVDSAIGAVDAVADEILGVL